MLFHKKIEDTGAPGPTGTARADARLAATDQPSASTRGAQARSVIDQCLIITGTLEGDGDLQIDGHVLGDVRCTRLTVGRDASIDGNIAAEEVVVRGRVRGAIGANRVVLGDGAHVESDIFHKQLAIEEGAEFHGTSRPKASPIDELHAMAAEMRKPSRADARGGDNNSALAGA